MTSNETGRPQQTTDGSKVTVKQQPTNHCNFDIMTTNHIMTKLTNQNHDQRHKYHHLTKTFHLTLKMTTAQVVETSPTNTVFLKSTFTWTLIQDKPFTIYHSIFTFSFIHFCFFCILLKPCWIMTCSFLLFTFCLVHHVYCKLFLHLTSAPCWQKLSKSSLESQ